MLNKIKRNTIRVSRYINNFWQKNSNKIMWKLLNNSKSLKIKYADYIINSNFSKSEDFVPLTNETHGVETNIKTLAFYLPQFHQTEVNNKYFGRGFTEWSKVTKTIPQFTGHYQPHLPIDVGFYDLSHDDIMSRQIELAKMYGIYGFCFYYYWFSGDTLLEKPILNFLNNKELNFPFCLMWTNETWTNIWGEGNEKKIIKEQKLLDDDDDKFANDILKYISDKRYIKIGNKPLIILYQSQFFEFKRFKKFVSNLRKKIKTAGFEDAYLLTSNSGQGKIEVEELNFDGVIEFTHQNLPINTYSSNLQGRFVNPNFGGRIIDIKKALENNKHLATKNDYKTFRCTYPGWDNSPRKAYAKQGCYVFDMTPKEFKIWFNDIVTWTKINHTKDEQLVFINAWNEWAEGAHLEPDQKYGYAYLQAVKDVLEETNDD